MGERGIKHTSVGSGLSQSEWEQEDIHELDHGNSFPGSPVERQRFYRDDLHKWYQWNASTWKDLTASGGGALPSVIWASKAFVGFNSDLSDRDNYWTVDGTADQTDINSAINYAA